MDKIFMRNQLLSNKKFLLSLYQGNNLQNDNEITRARDSEIDLVLRILHMLLNGHIPLSKNGLKQLKGGLAKSTLNRIKKQIGSGKQLKHMLNSSIDNKTNFVKSFSSCYSALLHCLFEEV
jgi:hypothetical protein